MNNQLEALCQRAAMQIAQNDPAAATSTLDQALALAPTCLPAHNLKEKHHLPGNFSEWMGVNAEISPDDDIFRFFASHPTSKNPFRDYLSDGWRTMMELQELLDSAGLSVGRCQSFLEFASGHGRFTRHLARVCKNGQLSVSDVVPGSVDFLRSTLGVKGFYSSTDPHALSIPEKYEVIFVLSLFSHLPSAVWKSWLQVLHAALKPGGLLILSTHGEKCARLDEVDLGTQGYRFFPSSESTALDGATYGTTFASLAYVRQAVTEALGSGVKVTAHANHFWGKQDAIVVSA
jgi:SAM-dependent methyltransferase